MAAVRFPKMAEEIICNDTPSNITFESMAASKCDTETLINKVLLTNIYGVSNMEDTKQNVGQV